MSSISSANLLITELLASPAQFDGKGKAHQLLQCYFRGVSIETLRPLLLNSNIFVRRSAAFVVSELGINARRLIDAISPLIYDVDIHTKWYALESVAVCADDDESAKYIFVIEQLCNDDDRMRRLAMRLISSANLDQISACIKNAHRLKGDVSTHLSGLHILQRWQDASDENIERLLLSSSFLLRYYGAISAQKVYSYNPNILEIATRNEDPDVSRFCLEFLQMRERRV